nr:hypothetical protein fc126 [uncultured bacterium]
MIEVAIRAPAPSTGSVGVSPANQRRRVQGSAISFQPSAFSQWVGCGPDAPIRGPHLNGTSRDAPRATALRSYPRTPLPGREGSGEGRIPRRFSPHPTLSPEGRGVVG